MQESIGGTLIFKIVMTFVVIFIALLALAVKYAHAFVVKNNIINIIEQCEGYNKGDGGCADKRLEKFKNQYKLTDDKSDPGHIEIEPSECIQYDTAGLWGKYYTVTTKIHFKLPFVEGFYIPIKGTTKTIFDVGSGTVCPGKGE